MGISKRYTASRLLPVLLILGMLTFFVGSCKSPGPASGMLTVNFINAVGHDGDIVMFGVYKEGVSYLGGTADALGLGVIAAGSAQSVALDPTLSEIMSFPGGGSYYVYAYIDEDPPGDGLPTPTTDLHGQGSVFTVDGNMTQTLDCSTFALVP